MGYAIYEAWFDMCWEKVPVEFIKVTQVLYYDGREEMGSSKLLSP